MKKDEQTISRRAALKTGVLGALGVLIQEGVPLFGAEASPSGPPYDLRGFKTYAEYREYCVEQGIMLKSVKPEKTNPSIAREAQLCMACGRCDEACMEQQIAHWYDPKTLKPEIKTLCMHCGQCVTACEYNALHEKLHFPAVMKAMARSQGTEDESQKLVFAATTAPALRVSLGELFGLEPGENLEGQTVAALRKLGFDYVFDTAFGADLTTCEEARELRRRLDEGVKGPMFTSCCPAWVTFVETFFPELIPNLSTTRSPIFAQGAAIKTKFAKEKGIDPSKIVNVAIVPCVAKKYEATRVENAKSAAYWKREDEFRDVDCALTTREIGDWASYRQIDPSALEPSAYDDPLGVGSGAGKIFGASGGVTRAVVRQFRYDATGEAPTSEPLELTESETIPGLREGTVEIGKYKLRIAVVCGLAGARALCEQAASGTSKYDLVEVMACPGGCVGGGGQPKTEDFERPTPEMLESRAKGLDAIDAQEPLRVAGENPSLQAFYRDFIEPGGEELREELLHTTYFKRDVWK